MKSILLVNLGTPSAPTPEAVRAYLAEFLSDRRVVALPRWLWLPVLHGIVLRKRPAQSAAKYAEIWMAEGSPLRVYTSRQAELLSDKTGLPVAYAMRYGEPSIAATLPRLEDPVVVPLYPQYADSTTGSVLDVLPANLIVAGDFHDHPGYIGAVGANVRRHWAKHGRGAMLLFSFHGLPKRGSGLYEKQCRRTAELLAKHLGLAQREWRIAFQSRFGYAKWLEPYTEATLTELARGGLQRVDVVCPGFVADCLETLEELGIRGREVFRQAGGREFQLVPCLNESPEWIAALAAIAAGTSARKDL
ncbi:MAG TPA: ferrochelatase [Burkholderiales bacterium]|nr:ferrochelatase [Burkholderiales bacterium]